MEAFANEQLDSLVAPPPQLLLTAAPDSAAAASDPAGGPQTEPAPAKSAAGADGMEAEEARGSVSEAEAVRRCSLYFALCGKRHRLLRHLLEVYGKAGAAPRCECAVARYCPDCKVRQPQGRVRQDSVHMHLLQRDVVIRSTTGVGHGGDPAPAGLHMAPSRTLT